MWSASELSDDGRGKGVKKLTRLPSGSRNSSDRLPQGSVMGSPTKSRWPQTRRQQPSGHARGTQITGNMCCHSLEPDNASEDTWADLARPSRPAIVTLRDSRSRASAIQILPIRRGWPPPAPRYLPSADAPILADLFATFAFCPGQYRPARWAARARALDPMRAPVWGRAGTGWRLPGSVGLVHFGGLPGLGVRSGRQHERGITCRGAALRPSEYPAIRSWPQDWDRGLAGGRRRAGVSRGRR
jgi:hypothetical protein